MRESNNVVASFRESANDRRADEAERSCDEYAHAVSQSEQLASVLPRKV
jgi:hypothetical protein